MAPKAKQPTKPMAETEFELLLRNASEQMKVRRPQLLKKARSTMRMPSSAA